jgi:hypothetical protein
MANLKFSQFTEQADPANVQFLVGYNGSDNVRIAPSNVADLSAYLPLAGGTMTGNLVVSPNIQLLFNNSNVKINTDNSSRMYLKASNSFYFETNGYQGRWSTTGLGVGTTSPSTKLHVKQTLASPSTPMVYFEADRSPSAFGAVNVRVDNLDYGNGMRFYSQGSIDSTAVSFYKIASQVGTISINASSTSYNTTSDYRLKENISPILNGIDRLKQLKPKRFNFIGDTSIVDGFIAHEAKEVVPESVTGEKDEVLPNGDPAYQGIDQGKLVPLLTASLQEAIAKIEFLETRIETLENA